MGENIWNMAQVYNSYPPELNPLRTNHVVDAARVSSNTEAMVVMITCHNPMCATCACGGRGGGRRRRQLRRAQQRHVNHCCSYHVPYGPTRATC